MKTTKAREKAASARTARRLLFRRKTVLSVVAILMTIVGTTTVHAQMAAPDGVWSLTGFDARTWEIVPTGGDFSALYNGAKILPGLDTIIENDIGAGFEINDVYRNPDCSPYSGPSGDGSPVLFDRFEILEGLGTRQGILWSDDLKRNLLEAFLFYRLHYASPL